MNICEIIGKKMNEKNDRDLVTRAAAAAADLTF
jgi:hypothetical protein